MTKNEDLIGLSEEQCVKFVNLQFTDVLGMPKNVAITIDRLPKVLERGCLFDGSSIEGFVRIEESDMVLKPDADTYSVLPWRQQGGRTARIICDVCMPDGSPFEGDPRHVLKKALAQAADMGYSYNVGPECEFFLFQVDGNGNPTTATHDEAGYFDLAPIDMGEEARRDICLTLEEMGFEIEASHHECAQGQHEIDFKYTDALRSADNIITFRAVVKTIAKRHGLYATFLPKPIYGIPGSGMHVNQSLFRDGVNAFCDEADALGLSKIARNFIAGVMAHIRGITAVTNPLVNSYKRLVAGYEAPVYIAWATKNRSPLIRIPAARGEGIRIELRNPDPSCNPYLSLACMLAAGLDGVRQDMKPPAAVERNIYAMNAHERAALSIKSLPGSLREAMDAMMADGLVINTLGNHVVTKFIEAKEREWEDYRQHVHQWELDNYLKIY
jgi:glutamine synthetase